MLEAFQGSRSQGGGMIGAFCAIMLRVDGGLVKR